MMLDTLVILVESITGVNPLQERRLKSVVEARVLLANALLNKGLTETETGALIGWGHSTIHHYRQRLRDAEQFDPALWKKWNKLLSLYD